MKNLMGIINLSENEDYIKELTYHRPIATIPFAGRYRIIDFTLSNMVNAGINNVAIFSQGKSRSIMDHLGTGKEWDLDRQRDGLFVLNPFFNINETRTRRGDIENFIDHIDYLQYSRQEYILLSSSYMVCNMDLSKAFEYYKKTNADITMIYKKIDKEHERFLDCNILNLDQKNNVISVGRNIDQECKCNISMEMYIMRKELLIEIIQSCIRTGENDYLQQAIISRVKDLHINAYEFDGFLSCINTIKSYYNTNRELLDVDILKELFFENGIIFTKTKNEASTKYTADAEIENSLIANGCVIEGKVENSIIGRGVRIHKNAIIKDSIIMNKGTIEEKVFLKDVILDKFVHITQGNVLNGDPINPLVIKKGIKI